MVTLKDIASATGINAGSVAHVLNGSPKALELREETRQKILDAAKRLGYQKNLFASVTRGGPSRIAAVICEPAAGADDARDFGVYMNRMMSGALNEAGKNNFSIKLHDTKDMDKTLDSISGYRIKHAVMIGGVPAVRKKAAEWARKNRAALVFASGEPVDGFPNVDSSDREGVLAGVRRLLNFGHTRVALLCGDLSFFYARERHAGYIQALEEAGIKPDERLVSCVCGDSAIEKGIETILSMPKDRRPTAFFCAGDSSALLLQRALILRGVRFPEDISVISFGGGTYLTRYAVIPLTAVWQPFEEMGAAAMRLALGQEKPGSPLILPTKLITGESDGPYENKK